jgi:hypothetical protein
LEKDKYDKGSYTIEASMIFTLIMLTVLMLLFTFTYMQQKTSLASAAAYAAQQGAELWLDSRRDIDNGSVNCAKDADPLGYRVFDNLLFSSRTYEGYIEEVEDAEGKDRYVLRMVTDSSLPGQKILLIGEAICTRMGSTVIRPENTKVKITYSNNILSGKLSVEIIQDIKVPLGSFKQFVDGKDTLTLKAQSIAAVTEPDEYIRNIDLAIELSKKLEGKLDLAGIVDKIR